MSEHIDRFNPDYWRSYNDENFRIFYQQDWIVEEEPTMPIIKFQMSVPDDFEYFAQVGVEVLELNVQYSLDEQMKNFKANIHNMINGLDNLVIEKNMDEHLPYLEIAFTGIIEGVVLQYAQYQWYICNRIITLSFITELDTSSDFAETKNMIFKTFQIK